jgi:hypothetical protein
VLELEPGNSWAAAVVQELQPVVQQRQEKMKEEMIGLLTTVCADSMSTSYVTPAVALCCPDQVYEPASVQCWVASMRRLDWQLHMSVPLHDLECPPQ